MVASGAKGSVLTRAELGDTIGLAVRTKREDADLSVLMIRIILHGAMRIVNASPQVFAAGDCLIPGF
jgi:hypothetical protein